MSPVSTKKKRKYSVLGRSKKRRDKRNRIVMASYEDTVQKNNEQIEMASYEDTVQKNNEQLSAKIVLPKVENVKNTNRHNTRSTYQAFRPTTTESFPLKNDEISLDYVKIMSLPVDITFESRSCI